MKDANVGRVAFVLATGMVIGGLFDLGYSGAASGIIIMLCVIGMAWASDKEGR